VAELRKAAMANRGCGAVAANANASLAAQELNRMLAGPRCRWHH
jgi:hypothetical protein